MLYPIVWEGIRIVESTGLKVIAITADGASPNRKFFQIHGLSKNTTVYKIKNVYASDDRDVFFFSDTLHSLDKNDTQLFVPLQYDQQQPVYVGKYMYRIPIPRLSMFVVMYTIVNICMPT